MNIRKIWRYLLAVVMLTATILASGLGSGRTRLFLGPVPDRNGYSAPQPQDYIDSYSDIREQYRKKTGFQSALELVDDIDDADIALEITSRGQRDTGERHQAPTVITHGKRRRDPDAIVPGAVTPINEKTLSARLVALNSDYSVEIDGRVRKGTYRELAKDVLQQVSDWAAHNRRTLRGDRKTEGKNE